MSGIFYAEEVNIRGSAAAPRAHRPLSGVSRTLIQDFSSARDALGAPIISAITGSSAIAAAAQVKPTLPADQQTMLNFLKAAGDVWKASSPNLRVVGLRKIGALGHDIQYLEDITDADRAQAESWWSSILTPFSERIKIAMVLKAAVVPPPRPTTPPPAVKPDAQPLPDILFFTVTPTAAVIGDTVTLRWKAINASFVALDDRRGYAAEDTATRRIDTLPQKFTLYAANANGRTDMESVTVFAGSAVTPTPPPAVVPPELEQPQPAPTPTPDSTTTSAATTPGTPTVNTASAATSYATQVTSEAASAAAQGPAQATAVDVSAEVDAAVVTEASAPPAIDVGPVSSSWKIGAGVLLAGLVVLSALKGMKE